MKSFKLIILISCITLINCNKEKKTNTDIIQVVTNPTAPNSALPVLFSNKSKYYLSWVTTLNDSISQLNFSEYKNQKWQPSREVIKGKKWFVNWADFPAIVENNGNFLSHILKKSSDETFAYDIKLNLLPKDSLQWRTNIPLHSDKTYTEHGFVTALPYGKDSFFITWLDGRNTVGSDENHGEMTLRAAEVSKHGEITNELLLDQKTCSCCQTTAAITNNGPIVLYRDRTNSEIRDIAITRRVEGKWTTPTFINNDGWEINGCPVNGPKVDALNNNLAVAWYTGANNQPTVKVIFSKDGGASFLKPIQISELTVMGRVDIALIKDDTALVSWMETFDKKAQIKAMMVKSNGEKSGEIIISTIEASRKTGFPQMTIIDNQAHFAWTDVKNDTTNINTAYVALKKFMMPF